MLVNYGKDKDRAFGRYLERPGGKGSDDASKKIIGRRESIKSRRIGSFSGEGDKWVRVEY